LEGVAVSTYFAGERARFTRAFGALGLVKGNPADDETEIRCQALLACLSAVLILFIDSLD
jgi:hypothetical protein